MYMSCKERVLSHVLPESMHHNKSLRWITPKVLCSSTTHKNWRERERERSWVKARKSSPLERKEEQEEELGKSEEELSATSDRAIGNDGGSCYDMN
jgi:hypothetical protein